jgi:hypothetical protein
MIRGTFSGARGRATDQAGMICGAFAGTRGRVTDEAGLKGQRR